MWSVGQGGARPTFHDLDNRARGEEANDTKCSSRAIEMISSSSYGSSTSQNLLMFERMGPGLVVMLLSWTHDTKSFVQMSVVFLVFLTVMTLALVFSLAG